ncbi:hypothetical protein [Histidinibacterium aquaticum]|uniref:Sulfotransferase family protein n=1 Tax=Histidinibacterium aquaticum TaxID=2613962 RepID=A0A5J5GAT5_9RHOB|nr:hypothetical protein [Histidinibacterium aquaticum]KAA9005225.1 hypothetical protein F3S47_18140 [Histidinibacterium aquaticum]
MRRVVIHAGFRKAGSTSIQSMLRANAHRLAPIEVHARDDLTEPFRKEAMTYCRTGAPRKLRKARAAAVVMARNCGGGTVVISDENLVGNRIVTERGETIYDLAALFLPMLEEAFSDAEVSFVLYTRDPDKWLRSAYRQDVANGNTAADFETWLGAIPGDLDSEAGIERLRGALKSAIRVVRMEDEAKEALGATVLRLAGVAEEELNRFEPAGRENASLGEAATEFLRQVNALSLGDRPRAQVAELVRRNQKLFGEQM